MHYKKRTKRIISVVICFAMIFTFVFSNMNGLSFAKKVSADNLPIKNIGSGSIGIGSNESEASKLPRTSTQGRIDLQQTIITKIIRHLIPMIGQVTGCGT